MSCSPSDVALYKSFVATSRGGGTTAASDVIKPTKQVIPIPGLHDYERQLLPDIGQDDMAIYKDYIRRGCTAWSQPTREDMDIYKDWVSHYQSACPYSA